MVQVLVVRVDIGVGGGYEFMSGDIEVVISTAMIAIQCRRSVVQVLVVRVDIVVVTYAGMTSQCGRPVVYVVIVRVDILELTYEGMNSQCSRSVVSSGCQSGYRSGDLWSYEIPVWEVCGSVPDCQSGYCQGNL